MRILYDILYVRITHAHTLNTYLYIYKYTRLHTYNANAEKGVGVREGKRV